MCEKVYLKSGTVSQWCEVHRLINEAMTEKVYKNNPKYETLLKKLHENTR